jgi:hypothetical protein
MKSKVDDNDGEYGALVLRQAKQNQFETSGLNELVKANRQFDKTDAAAVMQVTASRVHAFKFHFKATGLMP